MKHRPQQNDRNCVICFAEAKQTLHIALKFAQQASQRLPIGHREKIPASSRSIHAGPPGPEISDVCCRRRRDARPSQADSIDTRRRATRAPDMENEHKRDVSLLL